MILRTLHSRLFLPFSTMLVKRRIPAQSERGMETSDRGRLLGHKVTVIEWIASAMARYRIMLPAPLHGLAALFDGKSERAGMAGNSETGDVRGDDAVQHGSAVGNQAI